MCAKRAVEQVPQGFWEERAFDPLLDVGENYIPQRRMAQKVTVGRQHVWGTTELMTSEEPEKKKLSEIERHSAATWFKGPYLEMHAQPYCKGPGALNCLKFYTKLLIYEYIVFLLEKCSG